MKAKIKMKSPNDAKKPVSVSMPDRVKDIVTKGAEKEGRSFSDYACRVLEKHA